MNFQIIINIIVTASLIGLTSISFSLIYFTTKFFHLAHAIVITAAAYFTFHLATNLSLPLSLSVFIAIISAIIMGVSCELLVYRRMRKKNSSLLAYLIVSIGIYTVLQNSISMYFGDDTKILRVGEIMIGNEFFGAYITTIQIISVLTCIFLIASTILFLQFTFIGKSIRAVANNFNLCNIYGINSNKVILITFTIGSALAAIVGILSAMDTNITPFFGFNLLLYGVVTMIIGGIGSIKKLLISALFVAAAQNFTAYYIDTKWMDTITFVILILFLIWKPLGFSGVQLKKVEV